MFSNIKQQKKAIGPVISITLLLLVSISAMVFLSSWYSSFQSDFNSKVSVPQNEIEIKGLVDNFLFVRSYSPYNLSYNAIKIGNVDCSKSGILNSNDFNKINISNCTKQVPNGVDDIIIISDVGVFSKNLVISNTYLGCTLNGTSITSGNSYNFYNSSFVAPSFSCSSLNRFCSDGVLNGSSSFNISSCYVQDFTPNAFYFTNQTGISLSLLTSSNILTPTGYTENLVVNVTGSGSPQLRINGGAWTISSTMNLGDTLQLRLTSSSSYLTSNVINISLGGFSSLWEVKTISQDTMPDVFYFINQTGVSLNTNTLSNILTPTGYTGPLSVTITALIGGSPQFRINGGAWTTSSTMNLADTLQLRLTSSLFGLTSNIADITLGGFSSLWDVKTTSSVLVCPSNYIRVNGSNYGALGFANYDFCVMKYEAKCGLEDGSSCGNTGSPLSQPNGTSWTQVTQAESSSLCSGLGTNYNLINLSEWMLISRLVENESTNWANGIKYSTVASGGGLYIGAVNQLDSVSCGVRTGHDFPYNATSPAPNCVVGIRDKRTFNLSNDLLWDFSGNVWEYVSNTCDLVNWYDAAGSKIEWTDVNLADYEKPNAGPKSTYISTYGMGKYVKGCTGNGNPILMGGGYYDKANAGIYALRAYTGSGGSWSNRGFRCVYK